MRNGPPERKPLSLLPGGFAAGAPSKSPSYRAEAVIECHVGAFTRKPRIVLRAVIVRRPCCPLYAWPACEKVGAPDRAIALFPCPCWNDCVESCVTCPCPRPYGVKTNFVPSVVPVSESYFSGFFSWVGGSGAAGSCGISPGSPVAG